MVLGFQYFNNQVQNIDDESLNPSLVVYSTFLKSNFALIYILTDALIFIYALYDLYS